MDKEMKQGLSLADYTYVSLQIMQCGTGCLFCDGVHHQSGMRRERKYSRKTRRYLWKREYDLPLSGGEIIITG